MDYRRSSSVDEEAKIRHKHQVLLQEYLVLQKECVSKKRKLKEEKQRKETLLDEIRFLKKRRRLLLKIQSQNSERHQDVIQPQKPDAKYEAEATRRLVCASESPLKNSRPGMGSMWKSGTIAREELGFTSLRLGKKPKDLLTNGKRAEKRKISWQDQVALRV